jgi:hypothetical protein
MFGGAEPELVVSECAIPSVEGPATAQSATIRRTERELT